MMRLTFFTPAYPPFRGGGERYARQLALALAERGHALCVVTSQARDEGDFSRGRGQATVSEQDGPIAVWRLPLRPVAGGARALRARRLLMTAVAALPGPTVAWLERAARWFPPLVDADALADLPRPDLVHAFNLSWEHAALLGRAFANRHGCPYTMTPYAHLSPDGPATGARTLLMPHQRRLLTGSDAVLVLTGPVIAGLARHGVRPRRQAVLGAGLAPPEEMPDTEILGRLLLPDPFVLFLGRASADKGALDAARAVLRLRDAGRSIGLVLAGPVAPDFARFHRRLPPTERAGVQVLGLVSEAEKEALLAACSMLVLPSRTDALGLVLLEAWRHGRPVVAARAGGIPGIVRQASDGLLVPYGDVEALLQSIDSLLQAPAIADSMGALGQQRVKTEFTWERVADRAEAAYREILDAAKPA